MSYQYRHVEVLKVIDGDSAWLEIDQGHRSYWKDNFRLNGINAPERGTPGAAESTAYLVGLLKSGISRVETFKPDKYGRWLADIYVNTDGGELLVNKIMVVEGHAVEYDGGAR